MGVAIITGASRGLGLSLARALAERGWNLVVDARSAEPLAQAGKELFWPRHRGVEQSAAGLVLGEQQLNFGAKRTVGTATVEKPASLPRRERKWPTSR